VAVQHLVKIEGLWEKYQAQFDKIDQDVSRDSMLSFAKEIVGEKPHTMLAELNAVLTQGIPATGGQPLVRYPLSEWRIAHATGMGYEPKMMEAYEYAEKRFVDFRMREQKAYAMYLWAANVLETQCSLHPAQCTQPPRSTKDFKDDWNRYTCSRRPRSTPRSTGSCSPTAPTAWPSVQTFSWRTGRPTSCNAPTT
jgi:hypothetical protein